MMNYYTRLENFVFVNDADPRPPDRVSGEGREMDHKLQYNEGGSEKRPQNELRRFAP